MDSTAPDLFASYGFQQIIDIPTRVTLGSTSLIDLIFINKPDDLICHGTVPKIADHEGVLASFNIKSQKKKANSRIIFDYKNADEAGLIKFIKEFDFNSKVFSLPPENQTEIYTNKIELL